MAKGQLRTVVRQIRKLAGAPPFPPPAGGGGHGWGEAPDRFLLQRFVTSRDQEAFAELVRRHGKLVLDVCRHWLHHEQDAEDAFQAAFLVLAKRAGSIRNRDALAGWLYGVAYRIAMKAKKNAARLRMPARLPSLPPRVGEPQVTGTGGGAVPDPPSEASLRELQTVLQEEVNRLPENLRAPFVLCCLEGKSRAEAAQLLGWKDGTLSGRLAQARERLQKRLTRRGIALAAVLGAAAISANAASATVPAPLIDATVQAALLFTTGKALGAVSAQALSLAEGVINMMVISKVRANLILVLAASLLATGIGFGAYQALPTKPEDSPPDQAAKPVQKAANSSKPAQEKQVRTDRYGDPLPEGAIARLGTLRLRHGQSVRCVTFSPDGRTIASASDDSTVRLWDPKTGKELRRFLGHGGSVESVAFSVDGKTLASAGAQDSTIRLWDVASGKELKQLQGHEHGVNWVSFSADGKSLVSASTDRTVRLWDVATGRDRLFNEHKERPTFAVFSHDGKLVASSGQDKYVRLWEATTRKEVRRMKLGLNTAVIFCPDGKLLAAAEGERAVSLWDVTSGKEIRQFTGHGGWVALTFSPDAKSLAASEPGGTIRLWDVASGKQLQEFPGYNDRAYSIAFSPDGKTLASGSKNHTIRVWDIATGKEISPFGGHQGPVASVAFSPDQRLLATAGGDHTVRLWDVEKRKQVREFRGAQYWVKTVAFSPDGKSLASGGGDGTVHLWEVATGKELRQLDRTQTWIIQVLFSPDGKFLASAKQDELIDLWDLATGKKVRQFPGPSVHPCMDFSPDGKVLAAACRDKNAQQHNLIQLWDVASGKSVAQLAGHKFEIRSLVYSPDGRTLASCEGDALVHVREVASGKEIYQFLGLKESGPMSLAFAPDGKTLAIRGWYSDTILLWDLVSRKERGRFVGQHCCYELPMAFSLNGKILASGSDDTSVMLWDMTGISPQGQLPGLNLSPKELETLWKELSDEDAPRAFSAIWTLVAGAKETVPFLQKHLQPVSPIDAETQKQVNQWLTDLDSRQFEVREKATQELEKLCERAATALHKALKGKPSPEARRRAERLLQKLDGFPPSPEQLRLLRAIEVLEHIGTPEAQQVLKALANGAPEVRLTQEAKASLERLAR